MRSKCLGEVVEMLSCMSHRVRTFLNDTPTWSTHRINAVTEADKDLPRSDTWCSITREEYNNLARATTHVIKKSL